MSKNINAIVKMKFGSHLYGTSTPSSDLDYKGIFFPDMRDIYLGNIKKSIVANSNKDNTKNTSEDVDLEFYSLHYFLKLALEGQTVALDMLHAPPHVIEISSEIWEALVENKSRFYTKNLKAFVGYAKRQAAKYGIKGSRLNEMNTAIELLKSFDPELKMVVAWASLPVGEHSNHIEDNPNGIKQYQICGRTLQITAKIGYCLGILQKFYEAYGKRAKEAADNKGIDWKAISHALRAAYQVRQLLKTNNIIFPLEETDYLIQVKLGERDYLSDVAVELEAAIDEVQALSDKSPLPMKPDKGYWDNWLVDIIHRHGFATHHLTSVEI